jgi:hypothetical protein
VSAGPATPFRETATPHRRTPLPRVRGPVSGILLEVLRCEPGMPVELPMVDPSPELLADDDAQLAVEVVWGGA